MMNCVYFDGQLLMQTLVCIAIAATGLAAAIASRLAKARFGGYCILYGVTNCSIDDVSNTTVCQFEAGPTSVCSFIAVANIIAGVLFSVTCACYLAYLVNRSRSSIQVSAQMWLKALLVETSLACMLTLSAACTLTVGLTKWCNSLSLPDADIIDSEKIAAGNICEASQHFEQVTWQDESRKSPVNVGNYYDSFTTSESACWVSVGFWVVQLVCYVHRLVKLHQQQQQNRYRDAFTSEDTFDSFG